MSKTDMNSRIVKNFLLVALCALCCAAVCGVVNIPHVQASQAQTTAKGAVLMEAGSRRVLFSHNQNAKMPMASCTKIMTALLAVESGDLERIVEVRPEACGVEGSSIYLRPKEKLTLKELLYGLMLQSGNDCAVAIAYELAGSVPDFAAMMNKRAKELGAVNTNFVTPNGLHDDNHFTTAYDLGLISCEAMENDTFREIIESPRHSTAVTNIHPSGITYYSTMFKNLSDPSVTGGKILGGKTGYTSEAGLCLASFAEVYDREYILVTAGASGNTGSPLHVEDAVTIYNRLGKAIEAQTTGSDGSES